MEPESTPRKSTDGGSTREASGDRWSSMGIERSVAGVVLLVLGILILVFPQLLRWAVGAGAVVAGILLLGLGSSASRAGGRESDA